MSGIAPGLLMAALVLVLWSPTTAASDESREQMLKAAVVYKVAKFATWPQGEEVGEDGGFHLCHLGHSASMRHALSGLAGKELAGNEVHMPHGEENAAQIDECQLVFITDLARDELVGVLAPLKNRPILTISDVAGFAESGGMLELVRRDGKLGFVINLPASRAAGLMFAAPLLKLATVIDNAP